MASLWPFVAIGKRPMSRPPCAPAEPPRSAVRAYSGVASYRSSLDETMKRRCASRRQLFAFEAITLEDRLLATSAAMAGYIDVATSAV